MSSISLFRKLFGQNTSITSIERERPTPQHIGLFGYFGIGNFGNDGSLEAMLRFLREARPEAELLCICGSPSEVEPRLNVHSVRINWRPGNKLFQKVDRFLLNIPREIASLIKTAHQVRRLDVIVMPGTGILDDFGTGPKGMPYWIFRWSLLARILGTKVVLVSIGAGPIYHPLSRWLMKKAAEIAAYRSYRDDISRDFMQKLGLDVSTDLVCPDIAFELPKPALMREPSADGKPVTVGIGVMSYNGWRSDKAHDEALYDAYLGKLQSFARWLLSEGHRVRILMGDAVDLHTLQRLYSMIDSAHPGPFRPAVVAEPAHSLHDVMAQIAETDLVVATRYHNVVCALKLGRPVLSIGYAAKNNVLLEEMGLGDFCQHIEQLDVDLLIQQFRKLLAGRKGYEKIIRRTNAAFAERLRNQNDLLLSKHI